MRPAWLRPVRKRLTSRAGTSSEFGLSPPPSASALTEHNVVMQDAYPSSVSSPPQPPLHTNGMANSVIPQSFNPHFLSSQGGLMEPLMAGQMEPLSADMFAHEEISGFSANDLLALLGGNANGAPQNTINFGTSLLEPPTPLGFGMEMGMTMTMPLGGRTATSAMLSPGM
ncbi:hypothetical protein FRC02_009125 [Tulasnella sp. 418]|nr:hypothetical protein FRC02_009125 [Tulasnella sp. 418]